MAVQVGIKILRTPAGDCEKAVALYAPHTAKLAAAENAMLEDLDALTAKATHDYIEARKRARAAGQVEMPEEQ